MKRLLPFLLLIISYVACIAQSDCEKAKIDEIRKMYNSEMEWINIMLGDETIPDDYITAKVRHNLAGAGQAEETIEFFFNDDFNEEVGGYVSSLDFVRKTVVYTISERKKYEEFLYDKDGFPAFYYASFQTLCLQYGKHRWVYVEIRAYYDKGVLFHTICKVGDDESSLKEVAPEDFEDSIFDVFLQFGKLKDALDGMLN